MDLKSILGLVAPLYRAADHLLGLNNKDLEQWKAFAENKQHINDDTPDFQKDLLLQSVGFLKYFTWQEYEFLCEKSVRLRELKALNALKNHRLTYFHQGKFYTPDSKYAYKSLLMNGQWMLYIVVAVAAVLVAQGLLQEMLALNGGLIAYVIFIIAAVFTFAMMFILTTHHMSHYHWLAAKVKDEKLAGLVEIDCHFKEKITDMYD